MKSPMEHENEKQPSQAAALGPMGGETLGTNFSKGANTDGPFLATEDAGP